MNQNSPPPSTERRGRGRPPTHGEAMRKTSITLPPELRARIDAARGTESLASFIVRTLEANL